MLLSGRVDAWWNVIGDLPPAIRRDSVPGDLVYTAVGLLDGAAVSVVAGEPGAQGPAARLGVGVAEDLDVAHDGGGLDHHLRGRLPSRRFPHLPCRLLSPMTATTHSRSSRAVDGVGADGEPDTAGRSAVIGTRSPRVVAV